MNLIDVSFISINYNSSNYTIRLIDSIIKHTSINYEIIIIDNKSQQKDIDNLKTYIQNKNITLIQNNLNCGFACANMIGAKQANGKYLFFINNDTILLNNVAKILKQFLDTHPNIALATANILDENNKHSSSHKLFPSLTKELFGNSIARIFNKYPSNKQELNHPTPVEVISGACMFFKKDIFDAIHGFDTNFFLYCEEEDISKRVLNKGYQIYYIPEAEIFHKGGGSSKQNYELLREYYISYKYLISKHFNKISYITLLVLMYFKILRRSFKDNRYNKLLKEIDSKNSLKYKYKVST